MRTLQLFPFPSPAKDGLKFMSEAEAYRFAFWERAERPLPWIPSHFLETMTSTTSKTLVWSEEGALFGFAVLQIVVEEAYLLNIMVTAAARGVGLGTRLMKKVMGYARHCGATMMFLDVESRNYAAIRMYKKVGFIETATRPRAYPQGEKAIAMFCKL